jgi:hypothetical protein
VPRYLLVHTHGRDECPIAFAAWRGFESPLRHVGALGTCSVNGGDDPHRICWELETDGPAQALGAVPPWIAERTEVTEVGELTIP